MANTISICVLILVSVLKSVKSVIVNSSIGPIEGSFDGGYVNSYHGIPFARPPIGELRFASPQPITEPISNASHPWNATINPNNVPACPQYKTEDDAFIIDEDCLYLNVFTPADAKYGKTNYTVMIWIYGGSFQSGYSTLFLYDPTNWIEYVNDIIVVTINYRLGVLGFFYDNTFETGLHYIYTYTYISYILAL